MNASIGIHFGSNATNEEIGNEDGLTYLSCSVLPESFYRKELGSYNTFGMKVNIAEQTVILHDISTSAKTVSAIAELFNRCRLSAIHIQEALEDVL